jgi:uncharacterized membrane protein YhaH (DUF805 family)
MNYLVKFFSTSSKLKFWVVLLILLVFVGVSQQPNSILNSTLIFMILSLLVVLLAINTWIGRASDSGLSGWWGIGMMIPIVNFIAIAYLGFAPSKDAKEINNVTKF